MIQAHAHARRARALALACLGAMAAPLAQAAVPFCVFDMVGANGDAFNMAKDYAVAMQRENVDVELKAYTSEARAVEDFRAGRCDAVIATGLRTRPFNSVAASIDTLGSSTVVRNGRIDIPASYEVVRKLVQTFSAESPMVSQLMTNGKFEVGGILPVGVAYPVTNDRRINTIESLAGKRIAALEHDPAQAVMIRRIKAIPVAADIPNIANKLQAGQVDMIAVPAIAVKPLKIDQAMGPNGGIGRFPLMILTYQMIFDRSKFPEGFGGKSRSYWMTQFDRLIQLVKKSEADLPQSMWVDLNPENTYRYTLMLQEARIDIAQQGLYDKRGLKIIKKVRCHVNPTDAECKSKSEEDWNAVK